MVFRDGPAGREADEHPRYRSFALGLIVARLLALCQLDC